MIQKTSHFFTLICFVFLANAGLVLYINKLNMSCLCGNKRAHYLKINSTLTYETPGNLNVTNARKVKTSTVDFSYIMYMEPLVENDFPTISSNKPRIPHIIHQTYKNASIPVPFVNYVKSVVEKNPNWTYYFWTDESSRRFVANKFPTLLQMWDDYKSPINRADAIRYLVLYEYGGFYADLDVECKRPLDNITKKYACIFPTEPFEQSVFRLQIPYLFNNAIMFCRPKHPFLKQIIETLHEYQPMVARIDVAGPSFLTSQFIRYNNISADYVYKLKQSSESNSPYFYKGELPEDGEDAVYVPNTQYFINSLSQNWMSEQQYTSVCSKSSKTVVLMKACNEFFRRVSQNDRDRFAFTDHHWAHTYKDGINLTTRCRPLNDVVKKYNIF